MYMKNNKARIPHLEINEVFYIKDDELKMKLNENRAPREGSWDDLWNGVLEIVEKSQEYDEIYNQDNN